jgi:hypothetical protein
MPRPSCVTLSFTPQQGEVYSQLFLARQQESNFKNSPMRFGFSAPAIGRHIAIDKTHSFPAICWNFLAGFSEKIVTNGTTYAAHFSHLPYI